MVVPEQLTHSVDAVDPHLQPGPEHPVHAPAPGLGIGVSQRQPPHALQAVRRGAASHPSIQAFTTALKAHEPPL